MTLYVDQIKYAGVEPDSFADLTFIFTILETKTRDAKMRITWKNDVSAADPAGYGSITPATDVNGKVVLSVKVDTDHANFSSDDKYEADLWILDPDTGINPNPGKHRPDTFEISYDEPETTDFVVP